MNYASDPIWWRLKKTIVRDLASLLTAPSPWISTLELPISQLLGDDGFRFLLALDKQPEDLYIFLKKHSGYQSHLGIYAEKLLQYWFLNAPHSQLIAHNLTVMAKQRTAGAMDFIVQLNNQKYHLELACKYYGSYSNKLESFIGLNQSDLLKNKRDKIIQQLALSTSLEAKKSLAKLSVQPEELREASIIRGMLFTPTGNTHFQTPLNPLCWQGRYIEYWSDLEAPEDSRFYLLNHLSLLSPVRISSNAIVNFNQIKQIKQGIIARVQKHEDGYWHEAERIMKKDKNPVQP